MIGGDQGSGERIESGPDAVTVWSWMMELMVRKMLGIVIEVGKVSMG